MLSCSTQKPGGIFNGEALPPKSFNSPPCMQKRPGANGYTSILMISPASVRSTSTHAAFGRRMPAWCICPISETVHQEMMAKRKDPAASLVPTSAPSEGRAFLARHLCGFFALRVARAMLGAVLFPQLKAFYGAAVVANDQFRSHQGWRRHAHAQNL